MLGNENQRITDKSVRMRKGMRGTVRDGIRVRVRVRLRVRVPAMVVGCRGRAG